LKDTIVDKIIKEKELLFEKNERLEMTLKVPRKHMEFMRDNGKFEEFIDAKLLGKDVEAKWMLLDNAESDINKIMAKKVEPKKPMNVKPPKEA
jgi:hypothetical protein